MPLTTQIVPDPMPAWRAKKEAEKQTVLSKYTILGFISSGTFASCMFLRDPADEANDETLAGTYGRVYKAQIKQAPSPSLNPSDPPKPLLYAIKKFKPDKEGERTTYTGISQSAIREISLNRELSVVVDEARDGKAEHGRCENFVTLREVILEDKSIYMVFEYAEHDFLVSSLKHPT
jgi:cyclin-dependent kinase 8/11